MTEAAKSTEKEVKNVQVEIGKDSSTITLKDTKVEIGKDGNIVVYTNGTVTVKPAPANDTAIQAAKEALELGARMADGSVFAGLTADGKQQIYAMPTDLHITMTFNDAAKAVQNLNKDKFLGHDDWEIPSLENLHILRKNKDEGSLKGTFNLTGDKGSGYDYPGWYWSSTETRDDSSGVRIVRCSDGYESWHPKDGYSLSCRPVRIVAATNIPAKLGGAPKA